MKLLQQLVQIQSYSGKEQHIARFIRDYCQKNHIPVQIRDENVIIHLSGRNKTKGLILNAHMDTVSAGDEKKWMYPPVGKNAGNIIDGKLYGLGASDDKGAIAAMLLLSQSFISTPPPVDLWITFVTQEEIDGPGTESFLAWFMKSSYYKKYQKIAAIIGEPTGLHSVEIGHRGNAVMQLTTRGVSGHGGKTYQEKELAIEQMFCALTILKRVFTRWEKQYEDRVLGKPSMNITGISGSSPSDNKIPDICSAILDVRATPELYGKLNRLLCEVLGNTVELYHVHSAPAGLTKPTSPIVKFFKKMLPRVKVGVSLGSTDLCRFTQAGIDAVVFGPGEKEVIHKENEYCILEKVIECKDIYREFIKTYATA